MNVKLIDIKDWQKQPGETKGSREKQWVVKTPIKFPQPQIDFFLFKESHKRYPAEFWAEIIAAEVGRIVGVETPETHCGKLDDKYGALIRFFLHLEWKERDRRVQCEEESFEGGDLIMSIDPLFDRKKGETHNIYQVEKIFSHLDQSEWFNEFLKFLIFDAIIGNTDRHQDNWAFIKNSRTGALKLAPAFDNSTSLGSELVEEKLSGYLGQDDVKLKAYISKGKAHIRWSVDGVELIRLNHFELLKNIAGQKKAFIHEQVKEMTRFDDEQIESILGCLSRIDVQNPKYELSKVRRNFIKKLILTRRDLLKQAFKI